MIYNPIVESSPRMPKSNGSVVGSIIPHTIIGSKPEMTTPLLGPPTPPYRKYDYYILLISPYLLYTV